MRRGLLLVFALLLILLSIAAAVFVLVFLPQLQTPAQPTIVPIPVTPTPMPMAEIVAAAQEIRRGTLIDQDNVNSLVRLVPWPKEMLPPAEMIITDTAKVVGRRARYTIAPGEPVFTTMLVESLRDLSPAGSDAAASIPPGYVAVSLPYDKRDGVALGIMAGDYVNVIVSWAVIDFDQQFQTGLPNQTTYVVPANPDGMLPGALSLVGAPLPAGSTGPVGHVETDTNLGREFYVIPAGPASPRLVTQCLVQNAMVLHMGYYGPDANKPDVILPTATPDPNQPQGQQAPPPPTPTPVPPDIITLAVTPQDALVLNYLQRMMEMYPDRVRMTLALRSAGDEKLPPATTDSVTLQYMFENYNITLPAKLPYGIPTPLATATPRP